MKRSYNLIMTNQRTVVEDLRHRTERPTIEELDQVFGGGFINWAWKKTKRSKYVKDALTSVSWGGKIDYAIEVLGMVESLTNPLSLAVTLYQIPQAEDGPMKDLYDLIESVPMTGG